MGDLTKNFSLRELVHPVLMKQFGRRNYNSLNHRLAPTLQVIRDKFSGIVVNGRFKGVIYKNSGLRLPHGKVGAKRSPHKFGNGADCKFQKATPRKVYNYILKHQDEFPYIIRMEKIQYTKTWLHIEVATNKRVGKIYTFKPY